MGEPFLIKQTVKNKYIEMIHLKYEEFKKMINELNSIAEYFIDDEGHRLVFNIIKGTDQTFLWKFTIRIKCLKLKNDKPNPENIRILTLHEFYNIYNNIKQQAEALRLFQVESSQTSPQVSGNEPDQCGAGSASGAECCSDKKLYQSRLIDMISSISEPTESDEEICCICMEKKTDIILGCTHNFCENCIREWNITSNTCPICRCQSNNKDCFILTERPNYFNLQDEMSKSLFEITDRTNSKATTHNNHSRARENASDSD